MEQAEAGSRTQLTMEDLPPLPTLPITSKETLRKCSRLPVGPKDIFIASFPKSGTTWMQNIVYQLVAAERSLVTTGDELPSLDHISQYAPFYEIDAHWEVSSDQLVPKIRTAHEALGYRIFNTHLRWDMLPTTQSNSETEGGAAKFIYVVRDGRDTLTSFYHHMTNQHLDDGGFDGDIEAFFQQFLDGTVAYGKWSHHLASWMPHIIGSGGEKKNDQILLVRYEDLKKDLNHQVSRIATFLQLEGVMGIHSGSIGNSQPLDRVLERVSFEWMREHQHLFHPISVRWKPGYNFIRTGRVGDHGSIFDKEHQEKFISSVVADFGGKEKVPSWLREYCLHD